jgi:hypothetical protein
MRLHLMPSAEMWPQVVSDVGKASKRLIQGNFHMLVSFAMWPVLQEWVHDADTAVDGNGGNAESILFHVDDNACVR